MIAEQPIPELGRVTASAITEVLATQFKLLAIASTPGDKPVTGIPEQCLIDSVTLCGGRVAGDVHLQLPEAFAAKLTALLLGRSATSVTDESAADVTGELCNMLAGRVAAILSAAGYSSNLSTPRWFAATGWSSRFLQAPKLAGATGLARDICSQLRCSSDSSRDEPKNSECRRQQGRPDAFGPAFSPVRL